MAAPESTKWGNTVTGSKSTRKGKIGIYTGVSSTNTSVTVTVQVWFWSMYSIDDTNNSYYYNAASSATSLVGSRTIKHTVASGSGWSTSNQTKLGESKYTYNKGTSAATKNYAAKFTGIDSVGSSNVMSVSTSVTIPALASYTVSYNANGGSGAPSNQTKWYGKELTLSSTKPTRTGYSFQGWATSDDGSVAYASGDKYTANAKVTLYAVWKANTYTVKYDANGGSGAPANQTKTHGTTLVLSSTEPTRTNYTFKGWATSASGSVSYAAGANYTANASVTLYAVWELSYSKPSITNLTVSRCTSDGTISDSGTYAIVGFDWTTYLEVTNMCITWSANGDTIESWLSPSGTSGSVSEIIGDGEMSADTTYTISVYVADDNSSKRLSRYLTGTNYVLDVLKGGTGIAFNKPAELEGVADFNWTIRPIEGYMYPILPLGVDMNTLLTPNIWTLKSYSAGDYLNSPPITVSGTTGTLVIHSSGEVGQIIQEFISASKTNPVRYERHYYGDEWGDWICTWHNGNKVLWSGAHFMNANQTITLSEPISKQCNGIVLVFSRYSSSTAQNYHFNTHFVSKYQISKHAGCGHSFMITNDGTMSLFAVKYLYINDDSIKGNDVNESTGTGSSGITYTNNAYVLRYVVGV